MLKSIIMAEIKPDDVRFWDVFSPNFFEEVASHVQVVGIHFRDKKNLKEISIQIGEKLYNFDFERKEIRQMSVEVISGVVYYKGQEVIPIPTFMIYNLPDQVLMKIKRITAYFCYHLMTGSKLF